MLQLRNLKVKTKLLVSFGVTILFTLIIALIGLTGLKNANIHLNDYIKGPNTANEAVKLCRIEANNAARLIRDMYIKDDPSTMSQDAAQVESHITSLEGHVAELHAAYPAEDGLVEQYEAAIQGWIKIGRRAVEALRLGREAEVKSILINECSPALEQVVSIARSLDASTEQMTADALDYSLWSANIASFIILAAVALGIVLGVALALRITTGIVVPLREVRTASQNLAQGVLTAEITYESKDAIGQLSESMRTSLATLSGYISDIDQAITELSKGNFDLDFTKHFVGDFQNIEGCIRSFIDTMSSTLSSINQASEDVSNGSGQVSDGAQALSQGAAEQAAAIQKLAATIEDISTRVSLNAQYAEEANHTVETVSLHLVESDRQMEEMMAAMKEISDSSAEIGKVIKAIEDIAFQTNILALNASVEAARAGEAGKGFAVVADEVRNLAGKSAEASKSTSALIARSLRAVEAGGRIANTTAGSLRTVVTEAGKITEGISQIAASSQEQAQAVVEVTQGIEQISAVVQTNSATAEESAAASEELSAQARQLKLLVRRFHLKGQRDFLPGAGQELDRPEEQTWSPASGGGKY